MEQLSSHNDVNSTPSNTSNNVEDGDEFGTMISEEEPGKHHLSQSESWSESTEEAYWHYTNEVDKEDNEDGINEAKVEDRIRQCTESKRADLHMVSNLRTRSKEGMT